MSNNAIPAPSAEDLKIDLAARYAAWSSRDQDLLLLAVIRRCAAAEAERDACRAGGGKAAGSLLNIRAAQPAPPDPLARIRALAQEYADQRGEAVLLVADPPREKGASERNPVLPYFVLEVLASAAERAAAHKRFEPSGVVAT